MLSESVTAILGLKGCTVGVRGAARLSGTYRDGACEAHILTLVVCAVLDVAYHALNALTLLIITAVSLFFHIVFLSATVLGQRYY